MIVRLDAASARAPSAMRGATTASPARPPKSVGVVEAEEATLTLDSALARLCAGVKLASHARLLKAARELLLGSGAQRARAESAELRDAAEAATQRADDVRIATALQRISMNSEMRARLHAVLQPLPEPSAAAGGAADGIAIDGGVSSAGGSAPAHCTLAARDAGQEQTRGALLSLRGIVQEVVHKAGLVGAAAKEERPFLQKLRATQMFVQLERWERVHNAWRGRPARALAERGARAAASGVAADAAAQNAPLAMLSGMGIPADSPALWRCDGDTGGDRGGALGIGGDGSSRSGSRSGSGGGSGSGGLEGAGAGGSRRPKSWIMQTLSAVTQRRPASQRSALDAQIGRELDGLAALKQSAAVAFEDGQLSIAEYDHIIGVRTTAFVEWLGRVDDERVEQ